MSPSGRIVGRRLGATGGSAPAFTLAEIMVVVVIIGLLAAMAMAAFKRAQERSLASRMANDFRRYAAAFQQYNLSTGTWPAATTVAGDIPANMSGFLPATYSQASAMGGGYTWSGTTARLRLTNTQATDTDHAARRCDYRRRKSYYGRFCQDGLRRISFAVALTPAVRSAG